MSVPLVVPNLSGNEWKYVKDCLDTGWISSVGSYVTDFEDSIAAFTGAKHAIATVNGTAALHMSLELVGAKCNEVVLMPNITFVATANAVKYTGADPILIDADPSTWQLDLDLLEGFLESECERTSQGDSVVTKKEGKRVAAIIAVHVQGNIGDMERLLHISDKFSIPIVEDAAESLGSTYKGQHAGTFGKLSCLSFNGNKIISTGGGGMILTNCDETAARAKHLTTTAKTDPMRYFHDEVGYNYRLVNVLAAIGLAQMEQLPAFVERKRTVGDYYKDGLSGISDIGFQTVPSDVAHNSWLFTIQTESQAELLEHLNEHGIVSRPFWMPMNKLPMYKDAVYVSREDNADYIHKTCLAIPCSTNITYSELDDVISEIKKFFAKPKLPVQDGR